MLDESSLHYDILIVGGGPAGLATAIHLKQLCQQSKSSLNVAIIEKGSQIGAHILSGAIFETSALTELIPNWTELNTPLKTEVLHDKFYYLTKNRAFRLPVLPIMQNKGNYIISLGQLCKWLAEQAEKLGVDIFCGFSGDKLLYKDDTVIGILTDDKGRDKLGNPTHKFQPGIKIFAKKVVLAEGCRGSLTEQVIHKYRLRSSALPQTYGLGIKELWEVPESQHQTGTAIHTVGWPLDQATYGGAFVYTYEKNKVSLGLIVGLDYKNPYLDPFEELQKVKTHPLVQKLLHKGRRIGYGARALNEGGFQSIPEVIFPGGILVGDGAGFLNIAKIKGSHNAILSGITAAKALFKHWNDKAIIDLYTQSLKKSKIWEELYRVRNIRPAFKYGLWLGVIYSALDNYILKGLAPWTFKHNIDHTTLKQADSQKMIYYPKHDGKISFDKLSSVYLSGTFHEENQPSHLKLKNPKLAISLNYQKYASPETRYCPANVYEIVYNDNKEVKLQINAANCLHCKACDIKDPSQNIQWTIPQGGEGPNYLNM